MAVVSVAFDGTRWTDAEALSPTSPYGGDWYDSGGGAAAQEPDFIYQNTYSVSEKVKTSELGIGWVPDSALDMNTTKRVLILKTMVSSVGILDTTASQGANIEVGSGGRRSAYYEYYRYYGPGGSPEYPSTTSWIITAVDPNLSGYADNTTGSPSASAINWVGWVATMTSTSVKSENVVMDAIDYVTHGTGLTLTGGSSTDPDGTFQDFADYDEGTQNNRYGITTQKDGVFYVVGVLTIGTSTETDFTDSNQVLVFPDNYVDTGFCGVDIGLQNASSVIDMSAITLVGKGSEGADGGTADTRPDWGTTGTSGTATLDGMSFQNFNDIIFTSSVTVTASAFVQCGNVDQSGATISTSTFDNMTDAASILSDDPEAISYCTFISDGSNHAFEADTTGTYNFIGHTFTGYATTPPDSPGSTGNEVFYNNSGGSITLNASSITGTISVRNGSGASTTVNQTVNVTVTIKNQAGNNLPGVQVAIFQDDASRTTVLSSTSTDENGQVSTTAEINLGDIIIRARQSTKTADFLTTESSSDGIEAANDYVHFSSNHNFQTGDAVLYTKNGGSQVTGLTDSTIYYLNSVDADTVYVYDTAANAIAGTATGRQNLSSGGSETHSFDPVRYVAASGTGTIGTTDFSAQITMPTDTIATG